jgi:hypothetical protein
MFFSLVMVPIKYADHQDGLAGGRHLACYTFAERDGGSSSRAIARRAHCPQFVVGVHQHDRSAVTVEQIQRAVEDGVEHLFDVETEAGITT